MAVLAAMPITALSRCGEAPYVVNGGVGELMAPAETKQAVELIAPTEVDRAAELGTEHGAQRGGGLRRDAQVQRLRARLGEGVLGAGVGLPSGERCDEGFRRTAEIDPPAALELTIELVGAGLADRRARRQAGN